MAFPLDRFVSLGVFWIALLLALGTAYFAEGYPLATFGFQQSQKTLRTRLTEWILTTLAAVVIASVIIFFSTFVRNLLTDEPVPGLELVRLLPVWVLIPAWITGPFTEEVLFRSYPIEHLTQLTGKRWQASLMTIVVFAVLHFFGWDWIHVLTVVLPGGILLTLFYLWQRNLALNVFI